MKDQDSTFEEKQATLAAFLEDEFTLVHLNPEAPGVELPEHLSKNQTVSLKISRYFRGNLELCNNRVVADLLFNGSYFTCVIPFDAIWGCTSKQGKNVIWPENTPIDLLQGILEPTFNQDFEKTNQPKKVHKTTKKRSSHLRRVK